MAKVRLPVVQPADVRGRFHRARHAVFWVLIALWAALPWVPIGGHPAVFLDIEARRFFLWGASFNAQDTWLVFFLLTGIGFALVFLTALAGRVWCGWACPETVFLEGVFRPIQRILEGTRERRLRRDAAPWTASKVLRKTVAHVLYAAISFVIAHIVLSYFVSLPKLFDMVRARPGAHPEAFAWAFGMTAIMYLNFSRFRERLCTSVCPYGRLQGVLVDDDSLVVGYDSKRGEPRGKASSPDAGDCVDCKRCVVVCPTGIDIREGLQLECVACTACIDACDEVMAKLGRPRGLVRYDSTRGLAGIAGGARRLLRPRIILYTGLLLAGASAAGVAAASRSDYEAALLRAPGMPYAFEGDVLRNSFDLHLVNKRSTAETFHLSLEDVTAGASMQEQDIELEAMAGKHVPIAIRIPLEQYRGDFRLRVHVERVGATDRREVPATFVGGRR